LCLFVVVVVSLIRSILLHIRHNKFHNPFIIGGPKRFYSLFETVPYTKRTRFICLSTTFERNATKRFEEYKQRYEGYTMPSTYQESVRVTNILNNIIDALQRERNKMSPESECTISHLDGLNWEVLVVYLPYISGQCFPNGKIGLSWNLIRPFPSDAEKATIIAHEVFYFMILFCLTLCFYRKLLLGFKLWIHCDS